jgi:hypothetical protein
MSRNETRLLKLSAGRIGYTLLSMPRTAWYWLDDLVRSEYGNGGYSALMKAFEKAEDMESISRQLSTKAQEHCNARMADLYNLANDNAPPPVARMVKSNAHPDAPDLSARLPSLYWLFRFLPHATYLTTVWERRNYHLRGKED